MPCVHAKSLSSCPTLCDKMDCSPCPGSSIYGILQVRILESVVILFCRGSSQPGIEPGSVTSTCTGRGFFTTSATWKAQNKTVFIKNLKKHQELAALFPIHNQQSFLEQFYIHNQFERKVQRFLIYPLPPHMHYPLSTSFTRMIHLSPKRFR